jgi:magnesium chelatase family protein
LDLGIALAVLAAHEQVPQPIDIAAVGELALDGTLQPVRGMLVAALAAQRAGISRLLVPHTQAREAMLVPGLDVVGVATLYDAVMVLRGEPVILPALPDDIALSVAPPPDLVDVRGQVEARRALEVAAAGGHHLALLGPPGVGKSMLAERLPGLLPPLSDDLAVEVTAIHSAAGRLGVNQGLVRVPPFENPHHTATMAALVGGGAHAVRIGIVTLAHGGVLFLDEAAEFERPVLDAMRQPLESGHVTVSRTGFSMTMPARFQLVIASNPCPCGKFTGTGQDCSCSPQVRRRYLSRLSGPLLDRIDLRVTLERPTMADLEFDTTPESSTIVAQRVMQARERAAHRYADRMWLMNSHVPGPVLRRHYPPDASGQDLLRHHIAGLSARGADRVLRTAWTIADLEGHDRPTATDVASAMRFREGAGAWAA